MKIHSFKFFLIFTFFVFGVSSVNIISISAQGIKTNVLYISPELGGKTLSGLSLDSRNIEVTIQSVPQISVSYLDTFDVVLLNDANLTQSQLNILANWAQIEGHGIIVIMGPTLTKGNNILSRFNFTRDSSFQNNSGEISPDSDPDEFNKLKGIAVASTDKTVKSHPILGSIVWNTAPENFYWTLIPDLTENTVTYVKMQWNDATLNAQDDQEYPMLAGIQTGENLAPNVFLLSGWYQVAYETLNGNEHVMIWPFYNYLMFTLVQSSVGKPVPIYGKWDHSSVPHIEEQIIFGIIVVITAVGSVYAYYRVRREKDKVTKYFIPGKAVELKPKEDIYVDKEDDWEAVGFHRQLSGFLKLYFVMMILIIPQLLITSILMPQFLNPYPQSNGWYSYTLHFFEAIWLIFDLGFNYAIIRYFARYRLEHPEKAYHYVQLFIWWEILSGVVQIGLVAFIGSIVFPLTDFNYLSWMFVVHSLIQFPGIFLVFQYFFQGAQRSDYQMIAYALQALVLRLVLQVITVPLFKAIYQGNVMYGAAFGTSIGLLFGQLLGDWALFFITWKMYTSLNLPSRPVFAAAFNKEEFIETFKFGMKMALGEMWVPLVWLFQVWLVVLYIPNSSQEQGYFELAWTISQVPMALVLLTAGLLGGLTEAHEYGKKDLLNYTTVSGFKWSFTWTLYLSAAFLAIAETFIIGASGPLWIRAAQLLPLFLIQRMIGPPSWMADQAFPAANKPFYASISWIIEQGLRAVLMLVFLITFRAMEAVLWAYIISLVVKDIFVLIALRIKVNKWDWNVWPTYIAPILSAGLIFLLFKVFELILLDVLGLGQGLITAMLLLILVLFVGEFFHSFFYGIFGGYDDNTIQELHRSANMVTGVGFFARFYYKCAAIGCKISPLHNRFPITVYESAKLEADELTSIKRKLVE